MMVHALMGLCLSAAFTYLAALCLLHHHTTCNNLMGFSSCLYAGFTMSHLIHLLCLIRC